MKTIYTIAPKHQPTKIVVTDDQEDLILQACERIGIIINPEATNWHPFIEIGVGSETDRITGTSLVTARISPEQVELGFTRYHDPWVFLSLDRVALRDWQDISFQPNFLNLMFDFAKIRWFGLNRPWRIIDKEHLPQLLSSLEEYLPERIQWYEESGEFLRSTADRLVLDQLTKVGEQILRIARGELTPQDIIKMREAEFSPPRLSKER